MRRPPKFVNGYIDRHNKPRFYFRRAGFKRVPLPGLPWSPEFMAVYEQALAGQPTPVGAARVLPGTIRTDLNGVLHHRPKNLPESICAIRLFSSDSHQLDDVLPPHVSRDLVAVLLSLRIPFVTKTVKNVPID
jgi:hypothetical protein